MESNQLRGSWPKYRLQLSCRSWPKYWYQRLWLLDTTYYTTYYTTLTSGRKGLLKIYMQNETLSSVVVRI